MRCLCDWLFSPRFLAALRFCFSALYCAVKKTRRLASSSCVVPAFSKCFTKKHLSPLYLYYPTRGVPTSISPLAPRAACGRSPVCHPFTRAFSPVPVAPASGSITAAKLRSISAARSASGRAIPGASGASASASRRAATRRSSSAPKRRERAPMAGKRWRSFECGSESSSMSGPTLSGHLGSSRGGGRLERGGGKGDPRCSAHWRAMAAPAPPHRPPPPASFRLPRRPHRRACPRGCRTRRGSRRPGRCAAQAPAAGASPRRGRSPSRTHHLINV